MKKAWVFLLVLLLLPIVFAHAKLPDSMFDRGYQSCVKDDNEPVRKAYCACVRDGMKNWDLKTYAELAWQMATSGADAELPDLLDDLTKQCNTSLATP